MVVPCVEDAVDGPKSTKPTRFLKLTCGCTSGVEIAVKHHLVNATFNVIMSGWKKEDLERFIIAEMSLGLGVMDAAFQQHCDQDEFDLVLFVTLERTCGF